MWVKWRVVGEVEPRQLVETIADVVPPVGAAVALPDETTMYVRSVTWYPWADPIGVESSSGTGYVHVVLAATPPR